MHMRIYADVYVLHKREKMNRIICDFNEQQAWQMPSGNNLPSILLALHQCASRQSSLM